MIDADFEVPIESENHKVLYVKKRPGLDTFLKTMACYFEVIIYT